MVFVVSMYVIVVNNKTYSLVFELDIAVYAGNVPRINLSAVSL